jgi:hypothetical protein
MLAYAGAAVPRKASFKESFLGLLPLSRFGLPGTKRARHYDSLAIRRTLPYLSTENLIRGACFGKMSHHPP